MDVSVKFTDKEYEVMCKSLTVAIIHGDDRLSEDAKLLEQKMSMLAAIAFANKNGTIKS